LQGKYADALKTMQKLTQKDLENPSIAAYYGLILKANGKNAEAKAYLDRTSRAQFCRRSRLSSIKPKEVFSDER